MKIDIDTTNTSIKSITKAVIFLKIQSILVQSSALANPLQHKETKPYKLDSLATKCFNDQAQFSGRERAHMTLQASTLNDLGHGVTAHIYKLAITGNDDGIWISRNTPLIPTGGAGAIKVMRWRNIIVIQAENVDLQARDGFTHSPISIFFPVWLVDDDPEDLFDEVS